MFERFTDRARRVVVLAQEEAKALNHNYIGSEHILLALIREGEGVAAQVLTQLGADLSRVREVVLTLLGGESVGFQPADSDQALIARVLMERIDDSVIIRVAASDGTPIEVLSASVKFRTADGDVVTNTRKWPKAKKDAPAEASGPTNATDGPSSLEEKHGKV